MARLGTWMPFRAAQRELAFFLGVEVAEATVRRITEQAGATQMQVQAAEVEALLKERPDSSVGPAVQLLSLDGALIQAAEDDQVCEVSGAGLFHWQWVSRECQQTGRADSHETSGDALGLRPCESHVGDAQFGL